MIGQIAFTLAKNGELVTSGAALTNVKVAYIYVASETTFGTLTDTNGNDCTDTWANGGQNLSGAIPAGVTIAPRTGFYYKDITISGDGKVIVVRAED